MSQLRINQIIDNERDTIVDMANKTMTNTFVYNILTNRTDFKTQARNFLDVLLATKSHLAIINWLEYQSAREAKKWKQSIDSKESRSTSSPFIDNVIKDLTVIKEEICEQKLTPKYKLDKDVENELRSQLIRQYAGYLQRRYIALEPIEKAVVNKARTSRGGNRR